MIDNLSLPTSSRSVHPSVEFTSLLHLRWGAIICQLLLITLIALTVAETIPYPIITAIILFETVSNLFFQYQKDREYILPVWLFFGIMFVDVILLTVLLLQTGGAMNPFSFLYLLHIVIGAILMPAAWAWSLTILTNVCYTSLYFPFVTHLAGSPGGTGVSQPVCVDVLTTVSANQDKMGLHLKGMLVAFALTSLFIVYFIGKIRNALADYNLTVFQLKEEKTRSEQLASLATLAAGTAHELSTPLSTIKLVAGETLQSLDKTSKENVEIIEDLNLVRDQIEKCEEVLYQMSEGAGEHRGEQFQSFAVEDLVAEAVAMLPHDQDRIVITNQVSDFTIYGPCQTLKRTLKGILKNALDSDQSGRSEVRIDCWLDNDFLVFKVKDRGCGMDDEAIAKATEPFYTTKPPGSGMGLGLFLAQSVSERFGGKLSIASHPGEGTEVEIRFAKHLISRV